jgi:hypothetical protein
MSCCGKATGAIQQAGKAIVEKVATKFATPEVRAERLALCAACPKLKVLKKEYVSICTKCTCVVEGKTWLANEHCPLEKW